jgi:hypothetical protein
VKYMCRCMSVFSVGVCFCVCVRVCPGRLAGCCVVSFLFLRGRLGGWCVAGWVDSEVGVGGVPGWLRYLTYLTYFGWLLIVEARFITTEY